jgi:short-subunit dehydrogenase
MFHNPSHAPVCAVVGVGPGNGAAFVRRFAREGYALAMLARSKSVIEGLATELPLARAYLADVAMASEVAESFKQIVSDQGPVDVLIYNAGKGVWGSAEEVSIEDFEGSWRVNTLGAFAAARSVIPSMKAKGTGQIIFIGATASRRGGAKTAAFAPAKAAERSLAESLAKHLGPSGIHVSHIIVDGMVDEPVMRSKFADKSSDFFIKPEDLAETVFRLTRQNRSAWTFELDVRPFSENW